MPRVDTKALDGLRGFACLHVALGHIFGETTNPIDLGGGISMGLFFLISGVVMVLGYGQKKYDNAGGMPCETCCCSSFLACGCCAPTSLVNEHDQDQDLLDQSLAVTLQPSNETVPASKAYALADSNETTTAQAEEVEVKPFPSKEFLIKRFARLGPVYYLTSALAIPLWLCAFGGMDATITDFIPSVILTIFALTSYVIFVEQLNGVLWAVSTMTIFYLSFPCLVHRLQKIQSPSALRSVIRNMYWVQLGIFLCFFIPSMIAYFTLDTGVKDDDMEEMTTGSLAVVGFWVVWRTFPPLRLPVFIMGCCTTYMRLMTASDVAKSGEAPVTLKNSLVTYFPISSENPDFHAAAVLLAIAFCGFMNLYGLTEVIVARFFFEGVFPIVFADMCIIFMARSDTKLVPADSSSSSAEQEQAQEQGAAQCDNNNNNNTNTNTTPTTTTTPTLTPVSKQWSESYVETFCRTDAMQYMAKISYSFYAIHELVILYIGSFFAHRNPMWTIPITLMISLMLGALITRFFEAPLNDEIVARLGYSRTNRKTRVVQSV